MSSPSPPPPPQPAATPLPRPAFGQPRPARRPAWFWIAIVGGCFALLTPILLIFAAIAVPGSLTLKKAADQTSAIQTMRAIGRAELGYNVAFPANGFACSLAALGGDPKSGAPSPQAAQLLDPQVASTGQTSGYTFTIANCTKVRVNNRDTYISYHVTGVPQAIDRTGDNGYCSDDSLIIKTDPTGGTNCTEPIRYAGPRL